MKTDQIIKLVAAIVLLGGAGWWYSNSMRDDIPDTPDSITYWKCADCGFVEKLTDKQYDAQQQLTRKVKAEQAGGKPELRAGRAAGYLPILICPQCNHIAARVATKCKQCNTDDAIFIDRNENNSPGKCPKCGWMRIAPKYTSKSPADDE